MNKKQFYDLLKPLIEIYDSIEKELILDILACPTIDSIVTHIGIASQQATAR